MIGGTLIVAFTAGTLWLTGGRFVSTDNAYITAPKLVVATDVSGVVSEVLVHEGQAVKKGDVLFRIDPTPFRIAVASASAQLAQISLNLESMKQDYKRMQSDIAAQQAQVQLAQANFERASKLIKSGAATAVTYDQTRFTLNAAQKQNQSLEEQAKVLLAKLGGKLDSPASEHPTYLQAKAQFDEAQRQLDRTTIRAPFDGVVTQVDQLQPGAYLVAATAGITNAGAVALVGSDDLWIDANFKETDLTFASAGNPVEITVDSYPGHIWTGKVKSIAPASGAAFSILPAQNSSGNWVKVVQRFPVRIVVDRKTSGPALRTGMSVNVSIDTGHKRTLSELW
jgi:membrane fusion protein (multidrug efflux system)